MKIFTAKFTGVWLGGDAVVLAKDRRQARRMLKKEFRLLTENKGRAVGADLEIDEVKVEGLLAKPQVIILNDGDY